MFYFIFHSSLDFSAGSRNNIPKSKKNFMHLAACLQRCSVMRSESGGCVAWVWITKFEVVEFGVASEVAPHLAGRFLGEYDADGGTLPRGRPRNTTQARRHRHTQTHTGTHTHTHTLGLSAALHQSPSCPALYMFTFNRFLMCRQRAEK